MSQYQKGRGNATLVGFSCCLQAGKPIDWQRGAEQLTHIARGSHHRLWLFVVLLALMTSTNSLRALAAAPSPQAVPVAPAPLLLPALEWLSGDVTLHSHWADIGLTPGAAEQLTLALDARYHLRNDGKEDAAVRLRVELPRVDDLTLTVDTVPLELQPERDTAFVTQFTVPADGQIDLQLTYAASLPAGLLPELQYPLAQIDAWPGQTSAQINLLPAAGIPPAVWLRVEPADWRYAPPEVSVDTALQWLYDGNLPAAIRFQFIRPDLAQQLAQAQAAGDTVDALSMRAALYTRLATAAQEGGNDNAAERFYAQAVAGWIAALRQLETENAAASVTGPLHASLAALYRARVVGTDGSTDPAYAELMVAETAAALPGIMADDPRRAELERWQADGLRLLVADARRRGDVAGALALIDRLAAGPVGATNDTFLANERKALIVQQALTLLEAGDRVAALALAGDALTDPTLQPPDELPEPV